MAFYFVSTFAIAQTPTKQPALRLSRTKNHHFAKAPFPGFSAKEQCFAQQALESDVVRVVLHLEQPIKQSRLFPLSVNPVSVMQKLKKQLKAVDAHPYIVNQHNLTANMDWTVTG